MTNRPCFDITLVQIRCIQNIILHHHLLHCLSVFLSRAEVPPRKGSRKVEAVGIFPGATVIRGPDWQWGNQDGE